jgi:hypothetical protein
MSDEVLEYQPVSVVARRLGITQRGVRKAIERGTLTSKKVFGVTVVSDEEIERYRHEVLRRGK